MPKLPTELYPVATWGDNSILFPQHQVSNLQFVQDLQTDFRAKKEALLFKGNVGGEEVGMIATPLRTPGRIPRSRDLLLLEAPGKGTGTVVASRFATNWLVEQALRGGSQTSLWPEWRK